MAVMPDRILRRLRAQTGQTAAEYMGILLIVSVIIVALASSEVGGKIRDGVFDAICRIAGGECGDGPGGATADGRPPLSECVRSSSQRGIAGSVKVAVVELGGGVTGIKEVRADGSVKVTIKANARAGLKFGGPGAEVEAGGTAAGAGATTRITGNGEYGRSWTFDSGEDADRFVDDVKKKVSAIANPLPNAPFTDDDADIELPPHGETTYAGGVEVRTKGKFGGGTGYEGNLGVGGGATFNEDPNSPDFGDKTYYFEVAGGGSLQGSGRGAEASGLFAMGGGVQGTTRIALTYDKDGKEKSLKVIGTLDATATAELTRTLKGQDLTGFLASAKEAGRAGNGEAGGRMIFTADLDLRKPENLAAAQAFVTGRGADGRPVPRTDAAVGLYDRFKDDARMNARFYGVTKSRTGGEVDLGVFGVSGEVTTEDAQLLDAYYRDPNGGGFGGFQQWEDCVRSQV